MKKYFFPFLIVSVLSNAALAQNGTREDSLQRIEHTYSNSNAFSPNSPFLENTLRQAKSQNPEVASETWEKLKPEFSSSIGAALSSGGGLYGNAIRIAAQGLTDEELARVSVLLEDPALRKFQGALSSPEAQRSVMQAGMMSGLKMNAAINAVLKAHGYKEVH